MSPSRTPLRHREPTRRNRGHLTILDAMDDKNLFAPHFDNAESWVAWRAFLAVLFGYPLDEQQPDPTVVATLGVLIAADRTHWELLVVPLLWYAISGATLWAMQSPDAFLAPAAALLALVIACWKTLSRLGQASPA